MKQKQMLIDICRMFIYQLENDKCTAEELRSISDSCAENLDIDVTAETIANYYGQSESNVRNVISRNYTKNKPKRKVYYNFAWVSKIVPNTWHHTN
jgi:hypothetical protein